MLTLVVIVTFVASPARLPCACLFFSLPSRTRSCDAPRYPTPSCSQLCSRLLCVVRRSTSTRRGDLVFGVDASWVLFFYQEYLRNTHGIPTECNSPVFRIVFRYSFFLLELVLPLYFGIWRRTPVPRLLAVVYVYAAGESIS